MKTSRARNIALVDNADGTMLRNQIKILQHLQRVSGVTRTELAMHTGLTQAAVSKITAHLIETGTIEEAGLMTGRLGRRSIALRIRSDGWKVIGVKLSRRSYSVGLFDLSGQLLHESKGGIPAGEGYDKAFQEIKKIALGLITEHEDIAAVGVSVPGPFLSREKRILLISEYGVSPRKDIDLFSIFNSKEFAGKPVIISHDANAGVLADWWFGIEDRVFTGTVVHYLLGEGVGAGVIVDGQIFGGAQGASAEIGHVSVDSEGERCSCGNYGCLEMYCSSLAFVKDAQRRRDEVPDSALHAHRQLTPRLIFEAARTGDAAALACVNRAAYYIGLGLVNIINCYNPSAVILCNEMSVGGEYLLEKAKEVARQRLIPYLFETVDISVSKFKGDDILFGAAAVAIDYCLKNPGCLTITRQKEESQ